MNIPTLEKSSSMTAADSWNSPIPAFGIDSCGLSAPASPTGVWDLSFLFGNGGNKSIDPAVEEASVMTTRDNDTIVSQRPLETLPERMVDFFCIVGHELDTIKDFAHKAKDVKFDPKLLDCYPKSRPDLEFPAELPAFCLPNGSHLSTEKKGAELATFVLTSSNGNRLYGTVLATYEVIPLEDLCAAFWKGECLLPRWLEEPSPFYLPKCLVVISHHAFFDVQRKFLSQLHRIAISRRSPLPLERYIGSFMYDVPLPRQGLTKISWNCFTKDTVVKYHRPAPNELPLVNFSYRPIFRCLSISNILTLWGILLQEGRIVLQSENQALLTPVAEALTSLLFPLNWQGLYVPVLPSTMMDILDAPVPFLVGFVGRQCPQPNGVVTCDLDQDIVNLGVDENDQPRMLPQLPKNLIGSLKAELEDMADSLYLIPPCGIMGRVTSATHGLLENSMREYYAHQVDIREMSLSNTHRQFILSQANLCPRPKVLVPSDFITQGAEQTTYQSIEKTTMKPNNKNRGMGLAFLSSIKRQTRAIKNSTSGYTMGKRAAQQYDEEMELHRFSIASTLYEVDEELAESVRVNFLRFFSTLLRDYRSFTRNGYFAPTEYVNSLTDMTSGNKQFVESMVKTQMFERFLVESSTRRRLFDEHVNVNMNENMLVGKKKLETPFLDEQYSAIAKIVQPASPCSARIRRGLIFEYENFPNQLDHNDIIAHKNIDPVSALCYLGGDIFCGGGVAVEW